MTKTTVYLPDDLKAQLAQLAAETGQSEASLIRDALRLVIAEHAPPAPRFGIFESGEACLSERIDELLQGFGQP